MGLIRRHRALARWLVASLVVVLAWQGVAEARTWWRHRVPYQATAMNLRLTFAVHEAADQDAAITALGPDSSLRPLAPPFRQFAVGSLTFTQPPDAPAGAQYVLVFIDTRTNHLAALPEASSPGHVLDHTCWDGRFSNLAARYPWLSATAMTRSNGGWTGPGEAICFDPSIKGPITFDVALDPTAAPLTDPSRDLTVALGFVADDGYVFWAANLNGP